MLADSKEIHPSAVTGFLLDKTIAKRNPNPLHPDIRCPSFSERLHHHRAHRIRHVAERVEG